MSLLDHVRSTRPAVATEVLVNGSGPEPPAPLAQVPAPAVAPPAPEAAAPPVRVWRPVRPDAHLELRTRVHEELIQDLDPEQLMGDTSFASAARRAVELAAEERLSAAENGLTRQDRQRLASEIADEVLGLGPLEPLLRDPTVTEIMVNAWDRVYFERDGLIQRADTVFRDDGHVMNIIDKILRPVSRRLDDSSPMVDARLPDGSRVNAVIPPLAVHGPSLTIRKFSRELLSGEDLVRLSTLTRPTLDFLAACVRARANLVVSGGTGTGKTTLLNLLSGYIPPRERIVTIEDPAELQVKQDDWVSLETRPPNIEGKGQVQQRDLVKNALRMRPDRIIVGECRAGEAFDMLQAMNTGHDGSLTTVHANSPRDALARIENMVLMAVELPMMAIREQIASGINLLVHLTRLQDGSRRVTHISEIVGMQGNVISMHDIFEFQGRGIDAQGRVLGQLVPTGLRPHLLERLSQFGQHVPIETFLPRIIRVMDQTALVSVLVFLLVAQATLLVANSGTVERERVARRLGTYTAPTLERGLPTTVSILRRRRYSRLPWLDALLTRVDLADNMASRLQQAGLPLRAGEFLFIQLVVATSLGLLGAVFGWDGLGAVAAGLGALTGFLLPLGWLRVRIGRRLAAFEQGLPEVLDRVANALRAGFGLEYGLDLVARESSGPCAEEFGQLLQELNLGADLDEALARLLIRVDSEDARLLATAVAVQRRTGGNLVEVFSQMSQTLRDRERLRRDVRVLTTAPRVSGYVVALLPLLTVAVMYITSRYYIDTLLSEPIGRLAAAIGGGLVLLGLFLNHRIARVEL